MTNYIPIAIKIGAAIGHINLVRARMQSRSGYTFTKAELDDYIEQLSQASENLARAADYVASYATSKEGN